MDCKEFKPTLNHHLPEAEGVLPATGGVHTYPANSSIYRGRKDGLLALNNEVAQATQSNSMTPLIYTMTTAANQPLLPKSTTQPETFDAADFECSLCFRLFYRPVSTPCGHTYCRCNFYLPAN
jgi:hypothetical protein